jgi:hypothetical protein
MHGAVRKGRGQAGTRRDAARQNRANYFWLLFPFRLPRRRGLGFGLAPAGDYRGVCGRLPMGVITNPVDWIRVDPSELALIVHERARLAGKGTAELLAELGVFSGQPQSDLSAVLRDEARRMRGVCDSRDALDAYLRQWSHLVVALPSCRTRRLNRHPVPVTAQLVRERAADIASSIVAQYRAEEAALADDRWLKDDLWPFDA